MSKEGALWFPDLTIPDYTGMLPVFLGLANLANIEVDYHELTFANSARSLRLEYI